ncbi:MAG TPA: PAS domain-containing sensor histidine kinase [Ktedonobacterales bacterium]|nr:PAS domain-containing sensor histidine kinase [Ktedonobacterales bacterium]
MPVCAAPWAAPSCIGSPAAHDAAGLVGGPRATSSPPCPTRTRPEGSRMGTHRSVTTTTVAKRGAGRRASDSASPATGVSEALLAQTFLELAPDAVVVADAAGRILLANRQTEVLFGTQRSDLLGQPIERLLPEHFHAIHRRRRADYAAQPQTRPMGTGLDLYGRRQDGNEFPVEISLSPVGTGDELLIVAIIRDITDRKRLEAAERAAYADAEARLTLLQTVLDELPGGAYLVRGPGVRLVMANRAAEAVWGAAWPEGQSMEEFLHRTGVRYFAENGQPLAPDDLATVQVVQSGQRVRQRREVVRRPNGTRLPILVSAVALDPAILGQIGATAEPPSPSPAQAPASSPVWAALVLLQDVSLLQEAEQLKDEFISIAAHELRNPLAAILGFASMLDVQTAAGRGPVLADWQQEAIAEIMSATARLNALTDDLLEVTRIQAGRLELHLTPQYLVPLVRRCVTRAQATTTHHTLTLEVPAEPVLLEVDGLRLEQVLSNLLGNAIKYSPAGGPVEVSVQADRGAGLAEVRIRDRGIGIPAAQHDRLFQRFARASNVHEHNIPGSGLGLYVCHELVERHGGQLWFDSEEGEGTTFYLTLPLASLAEQLESPAGEGASHDDLLHASDDPEGIA